jgi:cation:H+ antiporter
MSLLLWIALFAISMAVLLKSADIFSDTAERLGLTLGIPAFIVGVTIVAFGTSLPELISSVYAVYNGASEIVLGNVVGSNLTNLLLVLGVAAIISGKINISYDLIHVDLPIFIGANLLIVLVSWDGSISFFEGLLLIIGLVVYLAYSMSKERKKDQGNIQKAMEKEHENAPKPMDRYAFGLFLLGIIGLFVGGKYAVDSIVQIATLLNLDSELVAISAFAIGTSLPEMFVVFSAARKGYSEIMVGSLLGSSIFNIFAVAGVPALIHGLAVTDLILYTFMPIMLATAFLYFFITQEKEITSWEGWLMIVFYLFFLSQVSLSFA